MLSIGKKYRVDEVPEETFAEWATICNEDGTKHANIISGHDKKITSDLKMQI